MKHPSFFFAGVMFHVKHAPLPRQKSPLRRKKLLKPTGFVVYYL